MQYDVMVMNPCLVIHNRRTNIKFIRGKHQIMYKVDTLDNPSLGETSHVHRTLPIFQTPTSI